MGECDGQVKDIDHIGTRIGAIFVILFTSLIFTLFPVVTKQIPKLSVPQPVYDFARYFGSGVIIATAFIHLLEPGNDDLSSECVNDRFRGYPLAYAFALIALMIMFLAELLAYRFGSYLAGGSERLASIVGHHHPSQHFAHHTEAQGELHCAPGSEQQEKEMQMKGIDDADVEFHGEMHSERDQIKAQSYEVVGVFVLEFGVVLHSVIIGMTLSITPWGSDEDDDDEKFYILFPVIVFHQLFEGLGLGSRLALLPKSFPMWTSWLMALFYSLCTPVGQAIGLGLRHSFSLDTPTGKYVPGILNSLSAGILIYTGLVELLAHDFIFNEKMHRAPIWMVCLNVLEVYAGAGIMAMLGKWA